MGTVWFVYCQSVWFISEYFSQINLYKKNSLQKKNTWNYMIYKYIGRNSILE